MCYKFFERIILGRIKTTVEDALQVEQAGFRCGRSTQDQVLAFTTFIENGFQERQKTGAVFFNLTSAYDTVWHKGLLLLKISKILPRWTVNTVVMLLQNRRFRVHMGDYTSSWRRQKNGLPQGSVLAPILFNLYTNDLPTTRSRKFIYADDICLAFQAKSFNELNTVLNEDLGSISNYCSHWRLQPSAKKTVVSAFHLHNANAADELNIHLNDNQLQHDHQPVYLGVTLDRTLTYKTHLQKVANKIRTGNNLTHILAGTSWDADARTLRTSSLALCYSVAPVWRNSVHFKLVDTQLHEVMRTISGTIRCTGLDWLPVLCQIAPPALRRKAATRNLSDKIHPGIPLHTDTTDHPRHRLKSRKPIWSNAPAKSFSIEEEWRWQWNQAQNLPNKDPMVECAKLLYTVVLRVFMLRLHPLCCI